jgi:zinc/manganese transport system substrate-binding protein
MRVVDRIALDYKTLDPADAAAFDQQRIAFVSEGLKRYAGLVQQIKQKYAGTPIGATESIVSPLSDALGLQVKTPPGFLTAISEGTDPTAQDKATFDDQIQRGQIAVLVFNTQNATPDVQRLVDAAKTKGIPVVGVTETLDPQTATFQDWQSSQLQALADALAKATGR